MKIGLIFPRFKYPSGDPPVGLAYIAAVLKEKTYSDIQVVDTTFHERSRYDIIKSLLHKRYDLVGISCMTTMVTDGLEIAEAIKGAYPETKIIFGGPHPTVMPDQTLASSCVDAVCIGEGEYTFLEIVNKKGYFENIAGIYYKDAGGNIIRNSPREHIGNLDEIPFPALEEIPMNKYFQYWFQLDSVARNLKGLNIITSRGCPYRCSFCQPTLDRLFGSKIRKRSSANIIDEIKHWKQEYGINAVMFLDDTLIIDKRWINETCDLLIREGVPVIWGCNVRANLVEHDLLAKMKKAGLRKVNMGIESGSQRVLDEVYNKRITLAQVKKAVSVFKAMALKVLGFFMIGAPTETEEEINKTIRFAKHLGIDEATFSITTPLPGTYLYDRTKEHIIGSISDLDYYSKSIYNTQLTLGQKKLNRLKKKALLSFYFSPKHIGYTINSFATMDAIKKSLMKFKRF